MKEKDNYTNLVERRKGKGEIHNIEVFLLYSAGEDYYNIYHEEKDNESKIISETDIN
jgi:hypothetical protein